MRNKILIIFLFFVQLVYAYDPKADFEKGNKAYNSKQYTEALKSYRQIIGNGYFSSEVYFNIANSYFKIDSVPSAILFYERAKKLSPADEDINFNLNAAYKRIPDRQEHLPELFFQQWFTGIGNMFSLKAWAILSITLICLACLMIGIYFFSRTRIIKVVTFFIGLLFILLSAGSYAMGAYQKKHLSENASAIIFKPSITAKSEPNGGTDLFILHEGTKVMLVEKVDDWCKIKIANGQVGWLPLTAVRLI